MSTSTCFLTPLIKSMGKRVDIGQGRDNLCMLVVDLKLGEFMDVGLRILGLCVKGFYFGIWLGKIRFKR
jgi:hypothetical protein